MLSKEERSAIKINGILYCLQKVSYKILQQFHLEDGEMMVVLEVFPGGKKIDWRGLAFARDREFLKKTRENFLMTVDTRPKGSPLPEVYKEWCFSRGLDHAEFDVRG